jgi:3-isopropylmalate/(R)-2-methylmalate dehydratase small subunit
VILEARAILIPGDDVNTDVLFPGAFLNITDVEQMKAHLFEGLDPGLRDELVGDTALVVGANFGPGSSREHVPQAMKASGIRFLVGKSFARIFYRNCVNVGLPAVISPEAVGTASPGALLQLDLDAATVAVDGKPFRVGAVPPFMREIFAAGGLIPWTRQQVDATTLVE